VSLFAFAIALPNITTSRAEGVPDETTYIGKKLVRDLSGAITTDPDLINPWGVAFFPGGPFWISDNGTGVSTVYDGDGTKIALTVTIPAPMTTPPGTKSAPTGQLANVTGDFSTPDTAATPAPAKFIFATEDGTIAAWNRSGYYATQAVIVADNSASKAVYKGLALGSNSIGNFLFATNFYSGKIDVFDKNFHLVTISDNIFKDPAIPSGYAPFGIANVNGDLFVTYAQQDTQMHDDVPGPGNGFVDVFDTSRHFLRRLATRGRLNSPWGLALAPLGFGKFGGNLLVGNFGDGRINVFGLQGDFLGQLGTTDRQPFTIPGLWSLTFGGAAKSNPDTLFVTAGPGDEKHGLFGSITPASTFTPP
jgi:uncharacterized protein (TIGR03118 family)